MLTQKAAETLKSKGGKRIEKPAGLIPGLYLVVQPSGAKSWALRYRANGQPTKLTLGSFPTITLAEARKRAGQALLDVKDDKDPHREKLQARRDGGLDRDVFEVVLDKFLAADGKRGPRRDRTIEEWRRLI